jgi:hypothetical protein
LRDDELRERLGESLRRVPAGDPPDIGPVAGRARRLMIRRRILASAVALGVVAAVVTPLAALLPLRPSAETPSGPRPPSGPGVLTVGQQFRPTGALYTEGAISYLRLEDQGGRLLAEASGHPTLPKLSEELAPGGYRLESYLRPCVGSCGSLDAPRDRCESPIEIRSGELVVATVLVHGALTACTIDVVRSALPPEVAVVICEPAGPRVLTPVVRPQQDGVHVRVRNTFDETVSLGLREVLGGGRGDGAPPGVSELVFPVAPGDLIATCSPGDADHGDARWRAPLQVVDPQRLFVPYALECGTGGGGREFTDYGPGAQGDHGDPVEIARRTLPGLRSTDVVERAGYPSERESSENAIVRVVRDGQVVQVAYYRSDGRGGWLQEMREGCA